MEQDEKLPTPEAIEYAQQRLQLAALRALIESHPNPESFRESWAHMLSMLHRENATQMAGHEDYLEDTNAAFRKLQPIWESYFPDGPAARSKPERP